MLINPKKIKRRTLSQRENDFLNIILLQSKKMEKEIKYENDINKIFESPKKKKNFKNQKKF